METVRSARYCRFTEPEVGPGMPATSRLFAERKTNALNRGQAFAAQDFARFAFHCAFDRVELPDSVRYFSCISIRSMCHPRDHVLLRDLVPGGQKRVELRSGIRGDVSRSGEIPNDAIFLRWKPLEMRLHLEQMWMEFSFPDIARNSSLDSIFCNPT